MMLAKSTLLSRPSVRPAASRPRAVVVRSSGQPTVDLTSKVQEAVKEAEDACAQGTAQDCAVAWDTVEELSAAVSHKKAANKADLTLSDPLEAFCQDAPDADECRVYED
ncbi:Calvin cycle protein CP12, chloroplastic [Tetrabaena socialis]|uniref:Calvin cycle protein CP12, chloroplastic n=1 Tax=Tetrabaena socialis TaxID=47790 RepID=A0A2J7ZJ17_9CHLO|nr:Calvin cycle protein CP12, chloroplastic [Tetrabaena socialis]|eukprot:PNH00257.1 Calvin cycle protein CP12, chloroplastic [Tetrabaena socialis]